MKLEVGKKYKFSEEIEVPGRYESTLLENKYQVIEIGKDRNETWVVLSGVFPCGENNYFFKMEDLEPFIEIEYDDGITKFVDESESETLFDSLEVGDLLIQFNDSDDIAEVMYKYDRKGSESRFVILKWGDESQGMWRDDSINSNFKKVTPEKPDESLYYSFVDADTYYVTVISGIINYLSQFKRFPKTAFNAFKKLPTGELIPVEFRKFVVYEDGSTKFVDELGV